MNSSITPEEFRDQIGAFEEELSWANGCWFMFQRLFSDPADVDRMNASARCFFLVFQKLLRHEIISSLCRLADKPTSMGGDANLTFKRLVTAYKDWATTGGEEKQHLSEKDLNKALSTIGSHMSALRDMRNERLSHLDQTKALDNAQWAIPLRHIAAVFETLNTYTTYMRLPLFDGVQLEYMDDTCREAPGEILSLLRDRPQAA